MLLLYSNDCIFMPLPRIRNLEGLKIQIRMMPCLQVFLIVLLAEKKVKGCVIDYDLKVCTSFKNKYPPAEPEVL